MRIPGSWASQSERGDRSFPTRSGGTTSGAARTLEVTYRGKRHKARATLVEDPEVVARHYESKFVELGPRDFPRRMGMRINLDRPPTHGEWLEAIRREKMSIVRIELRD